MSAEAALGALQGGLADQLGAEWPLTLHMLNGHAPMFFKRHGLRVELDGLKPLPLEPGLDADEAVARADARWLLQKYGRPVPPLELHLPDAPLHAWLIGEMLGAPRPYVRQGNELDLYWLTHRVLLGSDWLHKPYADAAVLDELQAALPKLWWPPNPDLLGEVLFCLQRGGRDVTEEASRFANFQQPDGAFMHAHCTAVGLLVLAFGDQQQRQPPDSTVR